MPTFEIACDYETSESAGAGGMYQLEQVLLDGVDVTDQVDQGLHFSSEHDDLTPYLANLFGIPKSKIDIESID